MNLNVNRPPQPPAQRQENAENAEAENNQQQGESSETEPLIETNENTQSSEPQVSWLTIARTFVVSFVASIIPEHPAM